MMVLATYLYHAKQQAQRNKHAGLCLVPLEPPSVQAIMDTPELPLLRTCCSAVYLFA
jgi:hypothetical protein